MENEKASFEQRTSVQRVSQIRSPKANLSFKKVHPCEICVQILRDFLYLNEYQGTHSKQKLHRCETCGKQLYVSINLHQHQKQCIGEKPFRRDVDRASFVKNCKYHVSGKPLVFRVVGKDFLASSQFLQQWATHTWERSNSRAECGMAFQRGKTYHNWEECTKAFSPKHTLVQHQRLLTREGCFMCNQCERSCNVSQHQKVYNGERTFEPGEHGILFNRKSNLIEHQRSNTRDRPYECTECGKSFTQCSNLFTHKRIHMKQKPYEYDEYTKSFSQSSTLLQHRRIHTRERPYECNECGRTFTQNSVLLQH